MSNVRPSNSSAPGSQERTTPNSDGITRTKILLLGLRRSGKTSIQQVLFNDLSPKQTFFLETTIRIAKHPVDTVIPLEIWDCPGNITVETLGASFQQFATLVFVIDVRDLYQHAIAKLVDFVVAACRENPNINFEVFVHKTEKLAEDDKIESFRQIQERVTDRLADMAPDLEPDILNFHLTSVFDHSLYEAFSRVLHKLIASLPYLEELLNVFCANSQSPKAFLFDTKSRLYVATDASPVDSATHNLCCDYLQMLNAFAPLYRSVSASPLRLRETSGTDKEATLVPTSTPQPSPSAAGTSSPSGKAPTTPSTAATALPAPPTNPRSWSKRLSHPSAATALSGTTTVTHHLITPHLALMALLPTAVYEGRRGLVEYNVVFLREGVREIWSVEWEGRSVA